jgi:hypothetical protein
MCWIWVASANLRGIASSKVLEYRAVGLMDLVSFEGWFFKPAALEGIS